MEKHSTPTPFIISWCLERVILRLQDLILHRLEAGVRVGVAAQTGLGSLGPLGETLQVEGLEVRGKREACAGPCREFAERKGAGAGRTLDSTSRSRAPRSRALRNPAPRLPASCARRPPTLRTCLSRRLPESPTRVDVGRGAARSSRHWLGSRSSRAAAVTLRLGLGALEEAGVC